MLSLLHRQHWCVDGTFLGMQTLTGIVALLGVAVFGLGVHGRLEMKFRVLGVRDHLKIVPDLTQKYQQLIRDEKAPEWPLTLWRWCAPIGVAVWISPVLWGICTGSLPR